MQLSLIENGLDSLRNGYEALNEYDKLLISNGDELKKSLLLKSAIIQTHHGIEILMKYILSNHSEFLIFSNLDENVKNAYKQKHQNKYNSIFEVSNIDKIHTVTYTEAFERLRYICNHSFSNNFVEKIETLNVYRNRLTHSEISIDDQEIILLFNGLLDELDLYLYEKIGDSYKTLSGYSELVKNYQNYELWLRQNGMLLKAEVISKLTDIFKKLHINKGVNEVKRIEDIDICTKLFSELLSCNFKLGTDLYNGICSGDVTEIKRISKNHLSIYAADNYGEEIIKFKSLIIYNPEYSADFSPIFILESDEDNDLSEIESCAKREEYSRKGKFLIEGYRISSKKDIIFDPEKINQIYYKIEEGNIDFTYNSVHKYLSKTIFCMINIQGLNYGRFDSLVTKEYNKDGSELEIILRNALTKRK